MSSSASTSAIRTTVTVAVPAEQAFKIFTSSFDSWWPRDFQIGSAKMAEAIIEPRAGGRWYELGVDGSECDWGRVLAWEPPRRLLLTWQINGQWHFDSDPARASEVEVLFSADGPERTTVELTHQHIDRLQDAEVIDRTLRGEGSWSAVLELFVKTARGQ